MTKELEAWKLTKKRYCDLERITRQQHQDKYGTILTFDQPYFGWDSIDKALEELETLRKKEIPMKVIDDCCPVCKRFVIQIDNDGSWNKTYDYCPHCGQRLDWGDKSE